MRKTSFAWSVLVAAFLFFTAALHSAFGAGVLSGGIGFAGSRFVDGLVKEDFAGATNRFDATMKAALSDQKLEEIWKKILDQTGPFQVQVRTRVLKQSSYDIALVTCKFERMMVDVKVVFNARQQVAGLFFLPSQAPASAIEPPAYAPTNSFGEKDFTVGSGAWQLPGTLTLPANATHLLPAVVLVHGSGPNDRDETLGANKPFRDLAWGLAAKGIAVLRYEKRTRIYADKLAAAGISNLTIKEETIDDAIVAAAQLRATPGIDPKRVFVLGHSLGGMAAPRIGQADPKLAGLILFAGCLARPLEDVISDQARYLVILNTNMTTDDQTRYEELLAQVDKIKALTPSNASSSELLLGAAPRYWLDLRQHDPLAAARTLKMPMLILCGGRDYQAPQADFDAWKKALAMQPAVTFKLYPNLNHLFMAGEGQSTPAEYEQPGHVDETAVSDIAGWVLGH